MSKIDIEEGWKRVVEMAKASFIDNSEEPLPGEIWVVKSKPSDSVVIAASRDARVVRYKPAGHTIELEMSVVEFTHKYRKR
jgi:hypothetical protein